MLLVNKLTVPGGIKKVFLRPGTVCIKTRDGRDILYRLVSAVSDNSESAEGKSDDPIHESAISS